MTWWIWVVAGLALMGLEAAAAGTFVLVFFGLGAVVAGLVCAVGVLPALWAQIGLFAGVSAGSLVLFRRRLLDAVRVPSQLEASLGDVVGGVVEMTEEAAPGARGRAEYRGASWTVLNEDVDALTKGTRARVLGVDGLTLRVRRE